MYVFWAVSIFVLNDSYIENIEANVCQWPPSKYIRFEWKTHEQADSYHEYFVNEKFVFFYDKFAFFLPPAPNIFSQITFACVCFCLFVDGFFCFFW